MQAEEVRKLRAENARLREEKAEMMAMLQSAQAALASVSRNFSTYVGQVCLVTSTRCSRDSIIWLSHHVDHHVDELMLSLVFHTDTTSRSPLTNGSQLTAPSLLQCQKNADNSPSKQEQT